MKKMYTALFLLTFFFIIEKANAQCTYFTKIVGAYHSLGIKNDGSLWAWGNNYYGQLGDGTTTDRLIPTQIGIATNWVNIETHGYHSLGIKNDGTIWAWGFNSSGQLGNGTTTNLLTPTQIGTATNWVSISGGYNNNFCIKSNGTLWAWGDNSTGQLGDGTTVNKSTPTQIGTATNWVSISAGSFHTSGITADGKAWAWGSNSVGQLGNGTTTNRTTPTQIGIATNWVSISTGAFHSSGITADGKAWAWGSNANGILGDGTTTNRTTPTQIGAATNWVSIKAGSVHNVGITADGKAWAWGNNPTGQLGDGTTTNRTTPTQIGSATNWASIFAGGYISNGITSDGIAWAWGDNASGKLGDGTINQRNSPTNLSGSTAPVYTSLAGNGSTSTQNQLSFVNYAPDCANLIATVTQLPNYVTAISGSTSAYLWIDATQNVQYVKRHIQITPTANASTAQGRVTMYATQAEFNDYNAVNTTGLLPTSSADATGKANLRIAKYAGTSSNISTGLPNTYSGTKVIIDPNDANIVWNSTASRWEITFDVTGFSGFFIAGNTSSILPLQWLSVNGTLNNQKQATINWQVQESNVATYTVEKSIDGRLFNTLTTVSSQGDGTNTYNFIDVTSLSGTGFYRIKQIDQNGKTTYSNIIGLTSKTNGFDIVNVTPNPVDNFSQTKLNIASGKAGKITVKVIDLNGKTVYTQASNVVAGSNALQLNLQNLAAGMYQIMAIANDGTFKVASIVK